MNKYVTAVVAVAVLALAGCSADYPSQSGSGSAPAVAVTTPSVGPVDGALAVAVPPTVGAEQPPVAAEPATFTISCPGWVPIYGGWVDVNMRWVDLRAYPPYRTHIDYGDGHQYENDDQHLRSVFSHRYVSAGDFQVTATLTDRLLNVVQSSCTIPVQAVVLGQAPDSGSGTSAPCADGTLTSSAGKQGACSSHGGLG
jgi:hypothetical protein